MTTLWYEYQVKIRVDRLVGGIPGNPHLIQAWLEAGRAAPGAEKTAATVAASGGALSLPDPVAEDVLAMLERADLDPEETHTCIFYRDPEGHPCYECRCFKAAFKEAANVLGSSTKRQGLLEVVNLRSKLAERVFVVGRYVRLENVQVMRFEKPISVMTMQGPRTSIKRAEYVEDVEMDFTLRVLRDNLITLEHIRTILDYMSVGGIGSDRSQGAGTFTLLDLRQTA